MQNLRNISLSSAIARERSADDGSRASGMSGIHIGTAAALGAGLRVHSNDEALAESCGGAACLRKLACRTESLA